MQELSGFPQVFGRYLLLRRLSRGGMGEVYLAKSGQVTGFEKLIIIKRILPHLSQDKNFSKRFIQEANIAIKLSHNNIVPVLEVGKVAGEFFLGLEYVEGRDVRAIQSTCYKKGELLPHHFALLIIRDLLTGLSYAHRRVDEMERKLEIVHCDISPPNVLVSYNGEIKIIDFGIAKSVQMTEDKDESQMGFGKFGYMAPEQVLKGGEIDSRTDLYSAGVMLWELLTGEKMVIFDDKTPYKEIAKKVVIDKPKKPSEINPTLGKIFDLLVMKSVAKLPEDRFQTASEFRDAVQMALVKIAPHISNDSLGEYILELFSDRIAEERQMLREAKQVDMNAYQMELTTAMEATVSFAVGDDWREMTGPINIQASSYPSDPQNPEVPQPLEKGLITGSLQKSMLTPLQAGSSSVHPPPPSDSSPTPAYLRGNVTSSIDPKMKLAAIIGMGLIFTIGAIFFFTRTTKNNSDPDYSSKTISTPAATKDSTPIKTIKKPDDMAKDPMKVVKPAMVPKTMKSHKTMRTIRSMNRPMRTNYRPMSMVKKPVMMKAVAMTPDPVEDTDALLAGKAKQMMGGTLHRYRKFQKNNGQILKSQWESLTKYYTYKKGSPNFYKKLIQKLNSFNSLMRKKSK
jgi:serine/threonine protein kinase